MEEEQESTDAVDGAEGKPSKRGGKTFLISIVAVIFIAVGGGAGAAYVFFPQVSRMITGTEVADDAAEAVEEAIEYGEFMRLSGFMVNPAGSGGRRALVVDVGLEGPNPKVLEGVTQKEVVIRDRILGKLSKLTVSQLSDISIRDSLKTDLLEEINGVLGEEKFHLSRLYFTTFMLQ
ncbi:MAG: flagellar FliL protein [Rhodothermales bacterium]|jgi:flagellar FliL protein